MEPFSSFVAHPPHSSHWSSLSPTYKSILINDCTGVQINLTFEIPKAKALVMLKRKKVFKNQF